MRWFSFLDLLLVPIFLLVFFSIADYFRTKYIQENPHYKYLFPALVGKLCGTFLFCWLYTVYYIDGGDTIAYHKSASSIVDILIHNPNQFFTAWLGEHSLMNWKLISYLDYEISYWFNFSSYNVVRLMVLIEIISLKSFIVSSLIISGISFIALWKIYLVFVNEFPLQRKGLIIIMFIPSLLLWTGGILKDTFVLIGLGFFLSCFVKLLQLKKIFQNIIGVLLSIAIILLVKPYVVIVLIPCAFWMFYLFKISKITNKVFKFIFRPIIFSLSFVFAIYALSFLSGKFAEYTDYKNIESFAQKSYKGFNSLKKDEEQNINAYNSSIFNNLDEVPILIKKALFLKGNSSSISRILVFLENGIMLVLLFLAMFNLFINIQLIKLDYLVSFSLIFGLLILFVVGYSVTNDGASSRLRTPGLLFLIPAITVIGNVKKVI